MPRRFFIVLVLLLFTTLLSVPCASQPSLARGKYLLLASYSDSYNEVIISVRLTHTIDGLFFLEATFIPPPGYHLYSKDLPRTGKNGQGRPTLLELPSNSQMQSIGAVTESVAPEMTSSGPDDMPVYPEGPVRLSLPIKLPLTNGWVNDQISLTYAPCTAMICKIPTIGKLIPVKVPGALSIAP